MKKILFSLVLFNFSILALDAQADIDIGEVLIENSSISKGLLIRKESISGKYIIPRADLLSFGYSTAGDVIKNLPLVYLDSDPGVNRNVSIGGLDRQYQAILINGRRPAGGEDSRDLKLDRIPVSMIERIEIDYNSPVSLGSGGIAGTVNIILKENQGSRGINAHLETNINTTDIKPGYKAELEGSKDFANLNLYGGLSYSSYQRLKTTELFDSSTDTKGGIEEEIITDMAAAILSGKLGAGQNGNIDFSGFFSWFDEDEFEDADIKRRKDGTLNIRQTNTDNDKLRYLMTYDAAYKYSKSNNSLTISGGFANNFEKRFKDQLQEKSDYFEEAQEYERLDNYSFTADILYIRDSINTDLIKGAFKSGLSFSNNNRNTDRVLATRPEGYLLWDYTDESYDMNENILTVFADLSLRVFEKLEILPAINFEYSGGNFQTFDTTGSHNFSHLAPSLHAKYSITDNLLVNASAARHIGRPSFMSMVPVKKVKIKKDLIEYGNPELLPSRALAFDLGFSYYLNSNSYISAKVYYKSVRDMIELRYTGIDASSSYNVYKYVNLDSAQLFGFYLDSRVDLNPYSYSGFALNLAYSFMGSSTRDIYTGGTKRIDGQPAHLLSLKLDYLNTSKRINISGGINYSSKRVISPFLSDEGLDIPKTEEDAYLTLTARIKYFLKAGGSIYLAGDNLLMKPVEITQGSVSETSYPGAIIRLGINLNFRAK